MIPASLLQPLQVAVGLLLVGYAAISVLGRVNWSAIRMPWPSAGKTAPVDDLRLVIDMAARLRDAGNLEAVKVCQALIDELLKPQSK